jgi:hypothetical protein
MKRELGNSDGPNGWKITAHGEGCGDAAKNGFSFKRAGKASLAGSLNQKP